MTAKPEHVFDREREWAGLAAFASNAHPGAMLGVVSGRRRQGKSFLLEALTAATDGLYFPAVEATEAVSLRSFTNLLVRQGIRGQQAYTGLGRRHRAAAVLAVQVGRGRW